MTSIRGGLVTCTLGLLLLACGGDSEPVTTATDGAITVRVDFEAEAYVVHNGTNMEYSLPAFPVLEVKRDSTWVRLSSDVDTPQVPLARLIAPGGSLEYRAEGLNDLRPGIYRVIVSYFPGGAIEESRHTQTEFSLPQG